MSDLPDLPPSWEWSTFGDVADIQLGRQRSPKHHLGPHMRPYLRSANVTWNGVDLNDVNEMNFDPDEVARYELRAGDILINEASGSPSEVGKPVVWRDEIPGCCFQNTLLRLRSTHLDPAYTYWYCAAAARAGWFGAVSRGVSIRHLGKRGLASFPIPVPPPIEQLRIAATLEELDSRIQRTVSSLSQALSRLSALEKQLILRGVKNDPPESHWRHMTVADAGDVDLGLMRSPIRHNGPSMRPYLRVANVLEDRIDSADVMSMHMSDEEWEQYRLREGDVLLNEGQSPQFLGRPAIYRGKPAGVAFTKSLLRFRASDEVDPEWALLVFRSHMHSGRFMRESRITTNIAHLAMVRFKTVDFPVPPLAEQRARVRHVRAQLDACDQLRKNLDAALRRAESLRRSMFIAAFSGQLVSPDPTHDDASAPRERLRADQSPRKHRPKSKVSR